MIELVNCLIVIECVTQAHKHTEDGSEGDSEGRREKGSSDSKLH